jgi:hypothetical protein
MARLVLRLFIMMFLLESTWAVAAQYCPHELGIDSISTAHQSFEHKLSAGSDFHESYVNTDNSANPSADSDCAYCHLGAMNSVLSTTDMPAAATVKPTPSEVVLFYPHLIPRQPERPNWPLAA